MTRFDLTLARSLLFVPGDRPERFPKALAAGPDGIIVDLEDAVALPAKENARAEAAKFLAGSETQGRCGLRINPITTRAGLDDLAALADGRLTADFLVIPKVDSPRDVEIVLSHLPGAPPLVATVESAIGLACAPDTARILRKGDALGFGGADFSADIGAVLAWEPLLVARSLMVQAAALVHCPVVDVPFIDVKDNAGLEAEALAVKRMGFTGKLAIHPGQVAGINAAFTPTAAEIDRAKRIVEAAKTAKGAFTVDGKMVDKPIIEQAERILRLTGA